MLFSFASFKQKDSSSRISACVYLCFASENQPGSYQWMILESNWHPVLEKTVYLYKLTVPSDGKKPVIDNVKSQDMTDMKIYKNAVRSSKH
ncbi:hypothetical protein SLA2020_108970 [Shorea laevis]